MIVSAARRTRLLATVLALACGLLGHGTVAAQSDVDAVLGDRFRGLIDASSDVDTMGFQAVAGTLFSAAVKGKFGLRPELELVDQSSGQLVDLTLFSKGVGKTKTAIKKLPLPNTGGYELRISGLSGSTGLFDAKIVGKPPKAAKSIKASATPAGNNDAAFAFEAVPGALLTVTIKVPKGSLAVPTTPRLAEPLADGAVLALDAFVTVATATRLVIKNVPLDEVGGYNLLVRNGGDDGQLDAKLKVRFPKSKQLLIEDDLPAIGKGKGAISGQISVQEIPVLPEIEPNDDPIDSDVVGTLVPGTVARVVGSVDDGGVPFSYDFSDFDGFRVTFSGDQDVSFILMHEVANDFDVLFFDDEFGTLSGVPNGFLPDLSFLITEFVPEAGILSLDLGGGGAVSLDVVVASWLGTGNYVMTMVSGPPGTGADGAAVGEPPVVLPLRGGHGTLTVRQGNPGKPAARPGIARVADRWAELDRPFVPAEFIVQLKDPQREPAQWASERGWQVRARSPAGHFVVHDPAAEEAGDERERRVRTVASKNRARLDPEVEYAELNELLQAFDEPNDQYFGLQWHYPQMNLGGAWSITQGSAAVLVAILDTGIFPHPDLAPRDTGFGYDMISSAGISLDGDGVDPDPTDVGDQNGPQGTSSWHGTHVGGTVGARTNDGTGVAGVDWNCGLMFVRVLGKGGGTNFDIYEGVRYAAGLVNASGALPEQAADVINMSLGGGSPTQTGANAVAAARAAGVTVVAAAGNENTSAPSYPASYDGVISVSATDFNRNLAQYSNFGAAIDVAAPGGDTNADANQDGYPDGVLSTLVSEDGGVLTPVLGFNQGTSMAAPHVAGVCALLLAVDPDLTPDEIEALLKSTAVDLGAPGPDQFFGEGLVDALAAVQAAQGGGAGDPALAASTTSAAFGSQGTSLNVALLNTGGGVVNYTSNAVENNGVGWLSVTNGNGTAPGTLTINVNRAAVGEGSYSGSVTVTGNGGAAGAVVIAVSMDKSTAGTGFILDVGPVFVLALDPVKFKTVGLGTATQDAPLFSMPSVKSGNWFVVAGPDLDNDGFICGLGEPCGLFPVLNEVSLVGVLPGLTTTGVDFSVGDTGSLLSAAIAPGVDGAWPLILPREGFRIP